MGSNDTIYHYGVKGMKWGVRRDARVLAAHRTNEAVRQAKNDYREGKISKSERKTAIKKAKNYKKEYKKELKSQFKNADRKERKQLNKDIVNQAKKEVGARRLKKAATSFNRATTVATLSGSAVALGAGFVAAPALAPLLAGSAAAATAGALGKQWIAQKLIDKVS